MQINAFLNSLPGLAERMSFARECGCSLTHLRFIGYGAKRCGEGLAIRIEQKSAGTVTVEELRPDVPWHVIRGRPPRTCSTDPVQRASTEVA